MKLRNNTVLLVLILLGEGFVTISVEVLSIRQLLPQVGGSVVVTSLIIGMFLLFLALGYHRGGQQQSEPRRLLARNLTIANALIAIGLSSYFIYLLFDFLMFHLRLYPLWALSFYLLITIAPIVYLLGQTLPLMTHFLKQSAVAKMSGQILSLSTIGSFLGAVLTSLVLVNLFGVEMTIVVNVVILAIITIILRPKSALWSAFIVLIAILFNLVFIRHAFVATTNYGDYVVVKGKLIKQNKEIKRLIINNSNSSQLDANGNGYPYISYMQKVLFKELKLRNKSILVLGAGGFTFSKKGYYDNHITYVDIDSKIRKIVKKYFNQDNLGHFIARDARNYLLLNRKKYDVIINDLYSSRSSVPGYLLTQQYFRLVKQHIRNNGFALFNIIANPLMNDNYSLRVDNTIRSIFHRCLATPIHYGNGFYNIIYVCHVIKDTPTKMVYTDNLNRATLDYFLLFNKVSHHG